MFKWPWKAEEQTGNGEIPWEQAVAIPVLANLTHQEQQQLCQMAARFYSKTSGAVTGI